MGSAVNLELRILYCSSTKKVGVRCLLAHKFTITCVVSTGVAITFDSESFRESQSHFSVLTVLEMLDSHDQITENLSCGRKLGVTCS